MANVDDSTVSGGVVGGGGLGSPGMVRDNNLQPPTLPRVPPPAAAAAAAVTRFRPHPQLIRVEQQLGLSAVDVAAAYSPAPPLSLGAIMSQQQQQQHAPIHHQYYNRTDAAPYYGHPLLLGSYNDSNSNAIFRPTSRAAVATTSPSTSSTAEMVNRVQQAKPLGEH